MITGTVLNGSHGPRERFRTVPMAVFKYVGNGLKRFPNISYRRSGTVLNGSHGPRERF
jgi:hypothetical protein